MEIYDYIKGPTNRQQPPPPPLLQPQSHPLQSLFQQPQQQPLPNIGYTYQDLYPFAIHDSPLWLELFVIADRASQELARGLESIRMCGAWLLLDDTYGFYIDPIIHTYENFGWPNRERYDLDRNQFLAPHKALLIQALKQLRTRYDAKQIVTDHPLPAELLTTGIIDPGGGLSPQDSMLWILLLLMTKENANFNAILIWIRQTGTQLTPDPEFGYRLAPIIDPAGQRGWSSKQEYDREMQQWMAPHTNTLIQELSWLSKRKRGVA